jgi:hypothetical protein
MKTRTVLLMVGTIGISWVVSGCSAIGFVGGTIIDNTFTEEKPLAVPTAEQVRNSELGLPKGETLVVENKDGQQHEGVYAGTRKVTIEVEREALPSLIGSGLAKFAAGTVQETKQIQLASRSVDVTDFGPGHSAPDENLHGGTIGQIRSENALVTVTTDALLILTDEGPVTIPVLEIGRLAVVRNKETTLRLVILGAITDFMLIQAAAGIILSSS